MVLFDMQYILTFPAIESIHHIEMFIMFVFLCLMTFITITELFFFKKNTVQGTVEFLKRKPEETTCSKVLHTEK